MRDILPPTNCPACNSELVYRNDQLFCEDSNCSAQWDKKVQHFASTLKIKGLGPATLDKLQIQEYEELYPSGEGDQGKGCRAVQALGCLR